MKRNTKKAIIVILITALLIGAVGVAIWKFTASVTDGAEPFVLLSEGFTDRRIVDKESALAAIEDVAEVLEIDDVRTEFSNCEVNTVSGNTYYRFQQEYEGIPVYGRNVVVAADESGNSLSLSGNYIDTEGVDTSPKIDEASVLEIAHQHYGEDAEIGAAGIYIYSLNSYSHSPELVWMLRVNTDQMMGLCFITTDDGTILYEKSLFDEYSNREVLDSIGADYYVNLNGEILLSDNYRGIISVALSQEDVYSDGVIEDLPRIACDADDDCDEYTTALKNLATSYDFFQNHLNLTSFDGDGSDIYLVFCDEDVGIENAKGNGHGEHGYLIIGTPDKIFSEPIGNALDIVGHEYTHMVTHHIVDLADSVETAAISEGVSDVFGNLIELQTYGVSNEVWQLGEDAGYSKYSMADSIDMTSFDYSETGGHSNAAIISHAAYLMWKGIDGSDAFEPLNTEELANLFYETLYTLPSDCTFAQFRALMQNTAEHQELSDKQRLCVSNAFFQVGIVSAATPVAKDHISIDVYGIDGLPYYDYTLYVQRGGDGVAYDGQIISNEGLVFPESGEYQLRVVDNANNDNETTVTVQALERGGAVSMPIFTQCGVAKLNNDADDSTETVETNVSFLSNDPFEDNKALFKLHEYEITGGIKENEGRYNTYTNLPDLPIIATLSDDFGHDGTMTQLTIEKEDARGGRDAYITVNFELPDGGGHRYGLDVGKSWDGESVFCYLLHGTDTDYLVIESLTPTSSAVGEDTFYIGRADGRRTEYIRIINLHDFSELEYRFQYEREYNSFTIHEDDSSEGNSQYLYCQDGEHHTYGSGFESLYTSFDDAMGHIEERLSAYGLEKRVGDNDVNYLDDDEVTLLFVEHRNGISQDIPLNSISDLELHDTMILGVNPQLSMEDTEGPSQSTPSTSIIGAWDSDDGGLRVVFSTTGLEIAITTDGFQNADGSVDIINLREADSVHGTYMIDGNSITIAADLQETRIPFTCSGDVLTIGEMTFHPIDQTLIDQLIGTWEGDGGKIYFGESNDMRVYEGSRSGSGFYAVLSESEVIINLDGEAIRTVPYSVTGNCLDFGGALLYKDGPDSSYSSTQSLKETLCGTWTWENGSFKDYYVFQEDGTYQYYSTETLYEIGQPIQDGFYEIQDAETIYLYPDRSSLPIVIQYDSERGLECSVGNYYHKVDE